MNIVFVINDLNYFAIHRQTLASAWLDRGWRVTIMAGEPPAARPALDPRLLLEPLPFARHRLSPLRDMACLFKVHRRTGVHGPDVVHAFTIKAVLLTGLSAILHRRISGTVLTFAGLGKIFEPSDALWRKVRRGVTVMVLRQIEKRCAPWTTFENEQDCARAVELGFASPDRSKVIQGAGIDLASFKPPTKQRKGKLRVVMASRLIATKGVDTFLEAARRLEGKAHFTLTGMRDGEDADAIDMKLVEDAARDGIVDWRGATPMAKMGDMLREHDVVVLPTRLKEGFPRSLLEAAACGCALVASRQDVIAKIVRPGETGWLLDRPDTETLMEALERAIDELERTRAMGDHAASLVSAMRVDTKAVIADMEDVYRQATGANVNV